MPDRFIVLRSDSPGIASALGERLYFSASYAGAMLRENLFLSVEDLAASDVAEVRRDPTVRGIAPAMPVRLIAPVSALGEAAVQAQWGIEAVGAHSSPYGGSEVTVAVLDTGIDLQHAAFKAIAGRITERDFTATSNGDRNGHGTHVAGTIFGQDVSGVRIGIARNVKRALIGKVLDDQGGGSTEGIFNAILWADAEGADVLSMSLGIDFPRMTHNLEQQGWPTELASSVTLEAYRATVRLFDTLAASLRARAMFDGGASIVCAAAGNESRRDADPRWVIAAAPPSSADGVVSVAALAKTSDPTKPYGVAPFSNAGANLAAPGVGILSAKAGSGSGLVAFSGTSMATPHVAGVAVLWADMLKKDGQSFSHISMMSRLLGQATRLPWLGAADVGLGMASAPN